MNCRQCKAHGHNMEYKVKRIEKENEIKFIIVMMDTNFSVHTEPVGAGSVCLSKEQEKV